MRRSVLKGCGGALLVSALLATAATALGVGDYSGTVKNTDGSLSFNVQKVNGHKAVVDFTVTNVPYTCDVGTPGNSSGMRFDKPARIHRDGTFATDGEVFLLGSDPSGKLDGVLAHGKAHGTFKIKGELDGPNSDCKTGKLGWKAAKAS